MKSLAVKPTLYSRRENDLSLSGTTVQALMREVLAMGLPFRFCATGGSMAPFIRNGDVLCVSPLKHALPRKGDVVAFVHPESGKLIVHRVIARRGSAYIIKGDNIPGQPDGVIPPDNILGRVTQVERSGKKVNLGLGPGRLVISFLSGNALLVPATARLATLYRFFCKRAAP